MRKTTFLVKCALVLLISCCFAISSSDAQGTYCGNAIVSNLNSNPQSLCSNGFAPRHYVYVPSASGEIEVCGTNLNVYRSCVSGNAVNVDNGTVVGSCSRGNIKRYSVTANTPIYFKIFRIGSNSCVDVNVVSTGATGISKLCSEGTVIECGQTISGDNLSGGNDFQTSDYTCFGGNDDFGGNDVVYKIDVPAGENEVIFRMQPLQKDLDMFIYRCFSGTPICITRSLNSGLNQESIRITNAQNKTYYVVIDGFNASQQGTFSLEVGGCGTPQLPDFTCEGGIPIECGDVVNSNNFDTGNEFQKSSYSNCFGGSATFEGNDELYTITLDQPTDLTIELSNMTADLDLFVLQCNADGVSNCIAASVNGPGSNDQITLNNISGELFIVVEAQYTTSLSTFTLSLVGEDCGKDCPEDNLACDDMAVVYGGGQSGSLRYGFQVPSSYGAGTWTVTGGSFGDQTTTIGSSRTAFYTFQQAGTYTICYNYKLDGCDVKCCRTIQIANPYDCDDIFYAYDSASNRYRLNIPGIESATWSDDDANRILGTGTSVEVPVSGACRKRNFSALFFDEAVGAYRMCCLSLYICDPYDCNAITFDYDSNDNNYVLTIPGITEATWLDDDAVAEIGNGTSVDVAVEGECRVRNFSVKFYDPGVNAYRICCLSLYVCNPYDCDDIQKIFDPVAGTWSLSTPGLASSDILYWQNDDTNTQIASGVNFVDVPHPGAGTCGNYSVLYFDQALQSYRVCCLQVCVDETACTGTPSDLSCADNNVVEDEPVCGCDGNTYESECDALAAGVFQWEAGPCLDDIDPDCDALTFDFIGSLRYNFTVGGLNNNQGAWTVTGPGFPVPRTIGAGGAVSYTFPSAGTYEVCFVYAETGGVVEGAVKQCCKTIEVLANQYDCNEIVYDYNTTEQVYTLTLPGITDAAWQDDDRNISLGVGESINIPVDGTCGTRNITALFYDVNTSSYRQCCISLYVCDPYDCNSIQKIYDPVTNSWSLSTPGLASSNILYWRNDNSGQSVATGINFVDVSNPSAGSCGNYSVFFFDPATETYRVCCLEICLDEDGCTGTPSDVNCTGNNVVEDEPVCGCDGNTYESECDALAAGIQSWEAGPCAEPIDPDCDDLTFEYLRPLRYRFSVGGLNNGTGAWTVTGPGFPVPRTIGAGGTVDYSFPQAGAYTICFVYTPRTGVVEGPVTQCCKTIYITDNPYDCNDITYNFNSDVNRYQLTIPGITDADVIKWLDDDNGRTIGTTSTVEVPVSGACERRNFSVTFYDASVGYYRICCISLYICDPYDCELINYAYNNDDNTYTLTIPGIQEATWLDDDDNINLGTGNTVTIGVDGECRTRNFSAYFYDPGLNAYRVCCISIYVCNPYDCENITYGYDNASSNYILNIPGIAAADIVRWQDDDTGENLGTTTSVSVATDNNCRVRNFSVLFYDQVVQAYRVCCISLYVCDPYSCASIEQTYDANTNTIGLSLPDVEQSHVLYWANDNTGQQLAGSTSAISVNNPEFGECVAVSVLFFDPATDSYRVCCLEICNNTPPVCAVASNATLACQADGTYNYDFTLANNSGQIVDAEFIMLTPGIAFNNCSLTQTFTNINTSQAISLTIDNCILPLNGGDQITYKIVLREAGKAEGWCCHVDPITITLPSCGNGPTCNDGIQNGDETGVDCGGSCPTACATCDDGIQNGDETGVDCGGSCPTTCATCDDGIQNGDETGVDCGGSCPTACATCDDGIQNGDETDVDCGGSNCPDCAPADCTDDTQLNLVRNGDFEGGYWAFTSEYDQSCSCDLDTYCISENAQNKCGNWNNITGDGKFLMVDAGRNSPFVIWEQSVIVQAGVEYTLCFDMYRNLSNGSSPVIRLFVDDERVGGAAPGQNNRWLNYQRTWTAPTSGAVSFSIQRVSAAGGSDDFGLDNIGMKYCPQNVTPEPEEVLTTRSTSTSIDMMASPNPFTDVTTISFTLDTEMPAKVSVFNMNGKQVFTQEGQFEAGINNVEFEADASLSAGVYYYRLETATQTMTKSMVLTKR